MTAFELAELENIFVYHAPHGDQPLRYEDLRMAAKFFATQIIEKCPDSRERSTAFAKVREAVMWANASIAINEVDQAPPPQIRRRRKEDKT